MRSESFVTVSGTYTVHIDGEDSSKPWALYLHGGPGFNSHGERQVLGGRFRPAVNTLWVDTLGCGEFQRASASPYSWQAQQVDLAAIIRRFAGGPVHLIGHCSTSANAHDLVKQGLLRSVTWYAPMYSLGEVFRGIARQGKEEGRIALQALSQEQAGNFEKFLATPDESLRREDALRFLEIVGVIRDFHELYWVDREAMNRYIALTAKQPFSPEAFLSLAGDLFERGPAEVPSYKGVPVLILHSDNDPVTPWELHGRKLAQAIPHARSVTVPGAGHWMQFENPDACVRETLAFLAGV